MKLGKKKVTLEEIEKLYHENSYHELYTRVNQLLIEEVITPIKSSGLNGKQPSLYKRYFIKEKQEDYSDYLEEIRYTLSPRLQLDYYVKHMDQYKKDRETIKCLDDYLKYAPHQEKMLSMNERSFQIWGREKYLQKEGGLTLIKQLGLTLEDLNVYETTVPLAYYIHHKKVPQTLLIIENKDTFFSMRRHLLEGNETICGIQIGTLVYGAGKQIIKSYAPFKMLAEPYLREQNKVLYFGDLDYEGIGIYNDLKEGSVYGKEITLFKEGYQKMLVKAEQARLPLPQTKEKQRKVDIQSFTNFFEAEEANQINAILQEGLYIPQESLNSLDF